MTMLDDDRLAALLGRAGAAFEVPPSGVEEILARAAGPARSAGGDDRAGDPPGDVDAPGDGDGLPGPSDHGRVRRLVVLAGRHRVLSAAACIIVVLAVAGTVVGLGRAPSPPTLTSAQPRTTHGAPLGGASTTVPHGLAVPGSAQKATAPAFGSTGSSSGAAVPAPVSTPTAPSLPSGAVGQPAKIEQTGSLGLNVGRGSLGRTMTKLTALAVGSGGFVAGSQTQSSGGSPFGSITLQVPVADFSAVLKQAQALGKTSDLTTKATDVTGQYVDLQARIAALEDSRQQYLSILAKATTVGDVLSVQEQIDTIQQQIEELQGQLQLLTSQTSYSTLTVTVSEGTPPPRPAPLPESGVVRAWHDSIGGFVTGVEGVIRIAGPVLFALLCLAAAVVGGRALWRRYQRHNL